MFAVALCRTQGWLIVLRLWWRLFCSWCCTNSCAAQGPLKHWIPSTSAPDRTQRASLFHKYCSVPFSTHSAWFIFLSTQSLEHPGCLEDLARVSLAHAVAVWAARRVQSCPSGRPCGQQVRDAERQAHGAVTSNNSMAQLSSVRVDDSCQAASPAVSHSQSWAEWHLRERSPAANTASGWRSPDNSRKLVVQGLFD